MEVLTWLIWFQESVDFHDFSTALEFTDKVWKDGEMLVRTLCKIFLLARNN